MIETLFAAGPNPAHPERMQEFGRFVGHWDVLVTWYRPDGSTERQSPGEWEFGYALEGRAMIDVWQVPPRAQRDPNAVVAEGECGMSVRFFDPAIDAWRSTWHGPVNSVVLPFIARQIGDDMVLERSEEGRTTRWMFTKITPQSFHWLNQVCENDGEWTLVQDMRATRRAATT